MKFKLRIFCNKACFFVVKLVEFTYKVKYAQGEHIVELLKIMTEPTIFAALIAAFAAVIIAVIQMVSSSKTKALTHRNEWLVKKLETAIEDLVVHYKIEEEYSKLQAEKGLKPYTVKMMVRKDLKEQGIFLSGEFTKSKVEQMKYRGFEQYRVKNS